MTITGILSCCCCFLTIILILVTSRTSHPWKKKTSSNQIILFIAFSDLVSSLGMIFGYCSDHSTLCWFQAVLTNLGPLWSIFWTTLLIYLVWGHLTSKNLDLSLPIHLFCWLIPIFLTFLPLLTNRFGCLGEQECWCFIAKRSDTPSWSTLFWIYLTFYFWMWLAFFGYIIFLLLIWFQHLPGANNSEVSIVIIKKLIGYPIIFLLCWFLPALHDIFLYTNISGRIETKTFLILFACLPSLQGVFTSLLYLITYLLAKENRIESLVFFSKSRGKGRQERDGLHLDHVMELDLPSEDPYHEISERRMSDDRFHEEGPREVKPKDRALKLESVTELN
jgi:hypothetical protein